jgi:heat shock protein HslJ
MRCSQLLLLTIVLLSSVSGQAQPMNGDDRLPETQWRLTCFGNTNAPSPVIHGTTITLKFRADGKVGGNGGCNSYGGDYQVRGDRLSLSGIISTKRACVQQEAMRQETQYFEALGSVGKFKLSGGQLTIFYDEERGALNFRAIDSQPVAELAIDSKQAKAALTSQPRQNRTEDSLVQRSQMFIDHTANRGSALQRSAMFQHRVETDLRFAPLERGVILQTPVL